MISAIESVLYVAGEPVSIVKLAEAFECPEKEFRRVVRVMEESYENDERGILLSRIGDKIQFCTNRKYASYIEKLLQPVQTQSLSQSVLETLSIIAYSQPVTRSEIEAIRGVKCDYSVGVLLSHGLIRETGRKDTIGKPVLFGTTDEFMRRFGIKNLKDLPPLKFNSPGQSEQQEMVLD